MTPLEIAALIDKSDNQDKTAKNIRHNISSFRRDYSKIFGKDKPLIINDKAGYRLNPELNIITDISMFEMYSSQARKNKDQDSRITHAVTYYPTTGTGVRTSVFHIHEPKTDAGKRDIPLLDVVKDALDILKEEEKEYGPNQQEIDGYSGFIFQNRFGALPNPQTVNRTIKRIVSSYNAEELLNAAKEKREPFILPDFSCHHLRHTFATRLCEAESNLKVIQSIMGHRNIETTMDIYAEATERKKQETFDVLAAKLDNLF